MGVARRAIEEQAGTRRALSAQARDQIPTEREGKFVFSTDGGKTHVQGFGKLKYRLDARLNFPRRGGFTICAGRW